MFYKNLLLQQTATDLTQASLIYTMPWRKSRSSFYYTKLAKEAAVYSSVDWTQSRYETPRYRKFSDRGVEIFLESSPWNRLNPTSVQDERELFDTNFFLPPLSNYFSPRFLINTIITSIAPDGRWNFFFLDRSNWIFLPILFFFTPRLSSSSRTNNKFDPIRRVCNFNGDAYRGRIGARLRQARVMKYYRTDISIEFHSLSVWGEPKFVRMLDFERCTIYIDAEDRPWDSRIIKSVNNQSIRTKGMRNGCT